MRAKVMPATVPVMDVHLNSVSDLKASLMDSITSASFIALDTELSGLGDRRQLRSSSMTARYEALTKVSQTRAIVALGIACFKAVSNKRTTNDHDDDDHGVAFESRVFNVWLLCSDDYIVETSSLRFLVEHNFDFNKQYALGLPYHRGNDKTSQVDHCGLEDTGTAREVFEMLVASKKPLVLHNGLIDLLFLYDNLYARLPSKLDNWVADLSQMFPAAIYDTKYVAEYVQRNNASYLEYLFRLQLGRNAEAHCQGKPYIEMSFDSFGMAKWTQSVGVWNSIEDRRMLCASFADHGHCSRSVRCEMSHDVDVVLERREGVNLRKLFNTGNEEKKLKMSKKRSADQLNDQLSVTGGHRAGYDAFMTGFVMATFLLNHSKLLQTLGQEGKTSFQPDVIGAEKLANRVYLSSKDFPLLIEKSKFANYSAAHYHKYRRLMEKYNLDSSNIS